MQQLLAVDLQSERDRLRTPSGQHTVAVGRAVTGNPALDCLVFTGASPEVKREANRRGVIPPEIQLDDDPLLRNRDIRAPKHQYASSLNHAEEELANRFHNTAKALGIPPRQVTGTLYLRQSNDTGVCTWCLKGIDQPKLKIEETGVLIQLSRRYPNLRIEVGTENPSRPNGRQSFALLNGRRVP
jgi:hypothetical protein